MKQREGHHSQPPMDGEPLHPTVLDVGTERIARVYAEALFRAAQQHKQQDEVLAELAAFVQDVLRQDPHFEAFLSSGAIGRHRKSEVIRSVFTNRASELFINALLVLNDHERLDLIRPIMLAYRELLEDRAGRMRVLVRSAAALPDDQLGRLQEELRDTYRKEPVLETEIDPELLGGVVVRIGDWVYDHSVRTELEAIRNQIIARSSHEIQSRRDSFCLANGN